MVGPKLQKLVDYCDIYPLRTAKFNDYKDWLQAFQIVKDKLHLTESGKSEIALLKSRMNKRRLQRSLIQHHRRDLHWLLS